MEKAIAGSAAATKTARAQLRARRGERSRPSSGQDPEGVREGPDEDPPQRAASGAGRGAPRACGRRRRASAQGLPGVVVVAPGEGQAQQGRPVDLPGQEQGDGDGRGEPAPARAGSRPPATAVEPEEEQGRDVDEVDQAGRPVAQPSLTPTAAGGRGLPQAEGIGEDEQQDEGPEGDGVGLGGGAHEDEALPGGDEEGGDPGHGRARPAAPAEPPDAQRRPPPGQQVEGGEAPVGPKGRCRRATR